MAYATLDELKDRLDWELDADEERIARSSLDDASELARYYGKDWADDAAPRLVKTVVLRACKRYMDNPQGYNQSRAGDETLGWSDRAPQVGSEAGSVHFTVAEQKMLAGLAGSKRGIYSAPISAWGTRPRRFEGLVPDAGSNEPIQMFSSDEEPW
ncbi:hypothetical protein [Micromonospora sp. NPDC049240]|uniref:hypothetical protein n=1 Tax=Micromonospora sp. NPDC049240 TaxID=3155151 RepID=UPI0033F1CEF9